MLAPLHRELTEDALTYEHLRVELDRGRGLARLVVQGPKVVPPAGGEEILREILREPTAYWPLATVRELDDALLHLRFNEPRLGLLVLASEGDLDLVARHDAALLEGRDHWLGREILLYWKRTLKRLDVSARTLFALVEPGSCFAGLLAELLFAADRIYMFSGERAGDDRPPPALRLSEASFGLLPMPNGLSRLQTRFLGEPERLLVAREAIGRDLDARAAEDAGLVTVVLDDVDWDDEVRVAIEERSSFSADALSGLEANLRFAGPETLESKIFGRLSPGRTGSSGAPTPPGRPERSSATAPACDPTSTPNGSDGSDIRCSVGRRAKSCTDGDRAMTDVVDYDSRIPNNVALASDPRVKRALEKWHPGYLDWWMDMGPEGFQTADVYLRTAVRVESKAGEDWAIFDYVKMPAYRWGILLAPQVPDRAIPFGEHRGQPAWQEVPGEYRAMLRRLIVIQGDTEPASVEQQRHLGQTAPSLYDMRNLFQVNVEEGRHLWAMVYLLHKYFGNDGREEARSSCAGARAAPMRRACSVPSTKPRQTGCRSFCSPSSPTATAGCNSRRSPSPASIRFRAPAASCSPKRRSTCSWVSRGSRGSSSAPARPCTKPESAMPTT